MEKLLFRTASPADLQRIMEIITQAQAQMKALGSGQWQDGYPAPEHIAADIARGTGRVLCKTAAAESGDPADREAATGTETHALPAGTAPSAAPEVIAYCAAIFDGEPAYDAIEGEWHTDEPYLVVHRLAVADGEKRRGMAGHLLDACAALARTHGCRSFRVDTNFDNRYMLRLLARQGFTRCGTVRYASGERIAFEREL